jgi:hypothetical protein
MCPGAPLGSVSSAYRPLVAIIRSHPAATLRHLLIIAGYLVASHPIEPSRFRAPRLTPVSSFAQLAQLSQTEQFMKTDRALRIISNSQSSFAPRRWTGSVYASRDIREASPQGNFKVCDLGVKSSRSAADT